MFHIFLGTGCGFSYSPRDWVEVTHIYIRMEWFWPVRGLWLNCVGGGWRGLVKSGSFSFF